MTYESRRPELNLLDHIILWSGIPTSIMLFIVAWIQNDGWRFVISGSFSVSIGMLAVWIVRNR